MPSKNKPLTDKELTAYEAERDLAADLLQAIYEMKSGQLKVVTSPVIEARKKTGLSQSQFAAIMGVSVRTLQGWEQGRKQPSGAARTLLAIASTNTQGRSCCCRSIARSTQPECLTRRSSGRLPAALLHKKPRRSW